MARASGKSSAFRGIGSRESTEIDVNKVINRLNQLTMKKEDYDTNKKMDQLIDRMKGLSDENKA